MTRTKCPMSNTDLDRDKGSQGYRLITAVVGALFLAIAVAILVVSELDRKSVV